MSRRVSGFNSSFSYENYSLKYTINWNTCIILIIPNTVSRLGAVGKSAAKAYFVHKNSLNWWLRLERGAGLNGASRDVN